VHGVPVAYQCDGQQGRGNDEQAGGLERVHMMPRVVPGLGMAVRGGGHEPIVAWTGVDGNRIEERGTARFKSGEMFHVERFVKLLVLSIT
jgi:hypothetical protein